MKKIGIALMVASITLTACGKRSDGDGTNGAATYTGTGTQQSGTVDVNTTVAQALLNVRVITDRNYIPTGGSDVAVITALVTNELNQAVADEPILISSTGGVLQAISATTDENGEATATLALAQDYQNQDIVVTVASGTASGSVLIQASGSSLDVAGPSALVLGNTAELTFTLKAGNDEPISNHELSLSSGAGNTITPATIITDSAGRASAVIGSANGDDTVSVSALDGSVTGIHDFNVAEDILSFADGVASAEYVVGSINDVVVTWESEGAPVAGGQLRFALTAGQLLSPAVVTTNAAGQATATVTSSSAGPATITVEANLTGDPATQIDVEFVATTPGKLVLDTSSSRVHTNDTSTIQALVTDTNGNPVKNQEVTFSSGDLKGGQLNPASAITNSAGQANVTFTAGDQATTLNEILIAAEVEGTSIEDTANLTVVERVLNITIGTSNFIEERANKTQYAMPYVVQVADGSGSPLQDATVEVSIEPVEYYKGTMRLYDINGLLNDDSAEWSASKWAPYDHVVCESEDDNGNRILDIAEGEDTNNNGELDPQDPALLAPVLDATTATLVGGALTTDARGSGYFELMYPASNAQWSKVKITARAQALGAEAEDSFITSLPLIAVRAADIVNSPPNYVSPYGESYSCLDED